MPRKHTAKRSPIPLYHNKPREKTNTELVTDFMVFRSALHQAFVIEALDSYAKAMIENETAIIEIMHPGFIPGEAWVQCAKDWAQELVDAHRVPLDVQVKVPEGKVVHPDDFKD